jgi:two-component system, cell cycle response regulator DivK
MSPTVLAIDAHNDSRIVYSIALRQQGVRVLEARNGKEALSTLASCLPHAIVMELTLPDLDGCSLIRTLKTDRTTARIPIVVVTSDIRLRRRKEAEAAGCDVFLLKPSPIRVLTRVVCGLIDPNSPVGSAL